MKVLTSFSQRLFSHSWYHELPILSHKSHKRNTNFLWWNMVFTSMSGYSQSSPPEKSPPSHWPPSNLAETRRPPCFAPGSAWWPCPGHGQLLTVFGRIRPATGDWTLKKVGTTYRCGWYTVNIWLIYMVYTYIYGYLIIWLVVRSPSWKMMDFVNGKDDIPYMKWNIIQMFENTNQYIVI